MKLDIGRLFLFPAPALIFGCWCAACGCDAPQTIADVRTVPKDGAARVDIRLDEGARLGFGPVRETGEANDATEISSSNLTWTAPEGWSEGPEKPMREVTYFTAGDAPAELSLTLLTGGAGGAEANFNRWMAQMGRPAMATGEFETLPTIEIFGRPAPAIQVEGVYTGMGAAPREGCALLGSIAPAPNGATAFVKMIGPAGTVRDERANFEAFCGSLKGKD